MRTRNRALAYTKASSRAVIQTNGSMMRQIVCVLALATAAALWPSADAAVSAPEVEPSSVARNRRSACFLMGSRDLCGLRYDQITWPGTHNSGSGFNGDLMFPSGGAPAPACFYRNQDMNYTAQLEFGIRWFDIDLCYVTEEEATPSVPAGLWTCHSNAYAGMVEDILRQIDDWMNAEGKTFIDNYVDVVSLHFNGDYDRSRSQPIAEALNQLLLETWPPQSIITRKKRGRIRLSMNNEFNLIGEWPVIYRVQNRNERVFVFLHESLQLGNQTWAHDTIPSESPSEVVKDSCDGLIDFTRGACNVCTDLWGVDAIGSLGNCISETAEICNTVTLNVSRACFDLRMEYGKTLNVIEVDFPARAPEGLSVVQVADMLNAINSNFFNGPPPLIPQPTDCNPGYVPTPSPSPLPRPTTYCEALTQIAQTPLYYLQCSPNDAMPCDRLVCPVDLFGDGLIFSVELAVEAGVCGEPANFLVSLGPFGGAPLSLVSANTTGLYLLLSFPLVITIDQMTDLEAIGVEVEIETGDNRPNPADVLLPYSVIPYECTESAGVTLRASLILVALQTISVVALYLWIDNQ